MCADTGIELPSIGETMTNFYPYRTRRKYSESEGNNEENTFDVRSESIGKSPSDTSPYLLANEWICGRVAQFLQLPIPSFTLVCKKSRSTRMFLSHKFERNTSRFEISPRSLYEAFPFLCTGIVVFDIYICNPDRLMRNLKVDRTSQPTKLHLIDHEKALLHVGQGQGIQYLKSMVDRLGVSSSLGSNRIGSDHCLIDLIIDYQDLVTWVRRVQDIPDWFIHCICEDVYRNPLTKRELRAVQDFLKKRRDKLWSLISTHKSRFRSLEFREWDLFV